MSNDQNPYAGGAGAYSGGAVKTQMSMDTPASLAPQNASSAPVAVKDISNQSFVADVIEASKQGPVVVDFWAPWCGPCKQLGPIIEKVAKQTKGVSLCKMDVEQYPEISQQMGIQSIPAVVAFIDGRPADAFMGAKSETEVQAFFDKLAVNTPEGADMSAALEEAEALANTGDYGGAAELYGAILAREPSSMEAFAGLGQCYVAVGEVAMAQQLIDKVPQERHSEPSLEKLIKTIALAQKADALGDLSSLANLVEQEPDNHQNRFDYALALNAQNERQLAVEHLITIVKNDRAWQEDGARLQLLEFFEAWGNSDPATLAGRRALSSILFS